MDFLRKLFGGNRTSTANALYFYVRPKRCQEIVEVRINLMNDLSEDEAGGWFVRKMVRANRCPFPAELHVHFTADRRVQQVGVQDGETVTEAEYLAWQAGQKQS
ncbi:MAG: hypothetical protein MUF87_15090 [Anaerolineae bacterium]|jgi:hypothetical protein|nr:hypothetical protein [Anaerolineae bacterium]